MTQRTTPPTRKEQRGKSGENRRQRRELSPGSILVIPLSVPAAVFVRPVLSSHHRICLWIIGAHSRNQTISPVSQPFCLCLFLCIYPWSRVESSRIESIFDYEDHDPLRYTTRTTFGIIFSFARLRIAVVQVRSCNIFCKIAFCICRKFIISLRYIFLSFERKDTSINSTYK